MKSDAIVSPDLIIFPSKGDSFFGLVSRHLVASLNLTANEDEFMSSLSAFLYESSSAFIIELSKNQFEPVLHQFVKLDNIRDFEKYIPRFLEKTTNLLKLVSPDLTLQDYVEQENGLMGQEAFHSRLIKTIPKKIKKNRNNAFLTFNYGKNRDNTFELICCLVEKNNCYGSSMINDIIQLSLCYSECTVHLLGKKNYKSKSTTENLLTGIMIRFSSNSLERIEKLQEELIKKIGDLNQDRSVKLNFLTKKMANKRIFEILLGFSWKLINNPVESFVHLSLFLNPTLLYRSRHLDTTIQPVDDSKVIESDQLIDESTQIEDETPDLIDVNDTNEIPQLANEIPQIIDESKKSSKNTTRDRTKLKLLAFMFFSIILFTANVFIYVIKFITNRIPLIESLIKSTIQLISYCMPYIISLIKFTIELISYVLPYLIRILKFTIQLIGYGIIAFGTIFKQAKNTIREERQRKSEEKGWKPFLKSANGKKQKIDKNRNKNIRIEETKKEPDYRSLISK